MDNATLYCIVGILYLLRIADAVANDPTIEYKRLGSCKVSIYISRYTNANNLYIEYVQIVVTNTHCSSLKNVCISTEQCSTHLVKRIEKKIIFLQMFTGIVQVVSIKTYNYSYIRACM